MLRSDVLQALGQGALIVVIVVVARAVMHDPQDIAFTVLMGAVAASADLVRRRRARRRTRVPDSTP
ncbi:hypothetical protein [Cellulomonas sp. SG140]|uniref:hypothetical protein n=1 Tax=Cellulomonas sp. SG140 TaxID=2976536 RepID=UPI0021E6FD3E|nr:hypothetical protein [Cellulomonas sp. SG140]